MKRFFFSALISTITLLSTGCLWVRVSDESSTPRVTVNGQTVPTKNPSLLVVWSSADRDVAIHSCINYVEDATKRKLFSDVSLIIVGPSAKLLAGDDELRQMVELLISVGTKVKASQESATTYGVLNTLKELGIEVKPTAALLTEKLKASETKVLTF